MNNEERLTGRQTMKPLEFYVKKLYDYNMVLGAKIWEPIAYQLTPKDNYNTHHNIGGLEVKLAVTGWTYNNCLNWSKGFNRNYPFFELFIATNNPQQPFLVPAEHFQAFRDAVHQYNMKYCQEEMFKLGLDFKILDDLYEYVYQKYESMDTHTGLRNNLSFFYSNLREYKATLSEDYFIFDVTQD